MVSCSLWKTPSYTHVRLRVKNCPVMRKAVLMPQTLWWDLGVSQWSPDNTLKTATLRYLAKDSFSVLTLHRWCRALAARWSFLFTDLQVLHPWYAPQRPNHMRRRWFSNWQPWNSLGNIMPFVLRYNSGKILQAENGLRMWTQALHLECIKCFKLYFQDVPLLSIC